MKNVREILSVPKSIVCSFDPDKLPRYFIVSWKDQDDTLNEVWFNNVNEATAFANKLYAIEINSLKERENEY